MKQGFIFYGDVPTKKNKYRIRGNGKGLYKTNQVLNYERMVAQELIAQRGKPITGPIALELVLIHGKAEPDIDGTVTTVLDAMQDGGLFANDRKVVSLYAFKRRSTDLKTDPIRVVVEITPAPL